MQSDSVEFQLLDGAFNALIKRILYPETSQIDISDQQRRAITGAFANIMSISVEVLEHGAPVDAVAAHLYATESRIAALRDYAGWSVTSIDGEIVLQPPDSHSISDENASIEPISDSIQPETDGN